jgi:hypothetical protein
MAVAIGAQFNLQKAWRAEIFGSFAISHVPQPELSPIVGVAIIK